MISVKFMSENGKLCGLEVSGHSTANANDQEGKLVCAFVSSACLMANNTISEVIKAKGEEYSESGFMCFHYQNPDDCTVKVLMGLKLHLTELEKQYSKRIKIITEV